MANHGKDWSAVRLRPGAELIVCWRPRRSRLDARSVELSVGVAERLRDLCTRTLDQLAARRRRLYGGNPYLEPGEEYLAVPAADLPSAQHPGQHPVAGPDTDDSLPDLERLIATPGLGSLTTDDLQAGSYLCYAVIVTDQDGTRIGFARQKDPHRVAKASPLKAFFGQEGLQKIDEPLFVFDEEFDLVVAPDEVAVLRLEAFHRMFADLHTIVAAAPANARLIGDHVPGMHDQAVDILAKAAENHPSLARRLQRLAKSGEIPPVTPEKLRKAMRRHKLNPDEIAPSNQEVSFTIDKAPVFLDLIEQMYYETDFTGEHRRADRYSPLSQQPGG
jgi:hypothetical protein